MPIPHSGIEHLMLSVVSGSPREPRIVELRAPRKPIGPLPPGSFPAYRHAAELPREALIPAAFVTLRFLHRIRI